MTTPPAVFCYDPPTVMKGKRYTMGTNTEITFKGGTPPRHRRQIIITNYGAVDPSTSTTVGIHIRTKPTGIFNSVTEPEENHAITIWGKSSISLFTNADVVVRNKHDTERVSVCVCEIFYE